jgi:hypothetical protein
MMSKEKVNKEDDEIVDSMKVVISVDGKGNFLGVIGCFMDLFDDEESTQRLVDYFNGRHIPSGIYPITYLRKKNDRFFYGVFIYAGNEKIFTDAGEEVSSFIDRLDGSGVDPDEFKAESDVDYKNVKGMDYEKFEAESV